MIKAIIFDLNGVFLEGKPLSVRFEEKYGIPVDQFLPALKVVMDKLRVRDAPRAIDLFEPYFREWKLSISEKEFFDFWFSGERLVPELVDYVKRLKEGGLKVFILSNNFKERTNYYRKAFPDFFGNFDGVYFSWETGFVKPTIKAYENLLEKNILKPDECLYFDDSDRNVGEAKNLGIISEKYEGLETAMSVIENLTAGNASKETD